MAQPDFGSDYSPVEEVVKNCPFCHDPMSSHEITEELIISRISGCHFTPEELAEKLIALESELPDEK